MTTIPLSLEEIANWYLKKRDEIEEGACWAEIPAFQRGLVWNAAQIEVLWDSLMRGIPIGVLSLLPISGRKKDFWVVDGQQRSNAISKGFDSFPTEENRSILWLDLRPDRKKRQRRKFFFYVTTPGRPWGYKITDGNRENDLEKVSTDDYRKVFCEIGWDLSKGSKPETFRIWPVMAKLPVPFCELRALWRSCPDADVKELVEKLSKGNEAWRKHFVNGVKEEKGKAVKEGTSEEEFWEGLTNEFKIVFDGLKRVDGTTVFGLVTPAALSGEDEGDEGSDENSAIAVYFDRLNVGGTPPSREDLDYSILKSIIPELSKLDEYAKGLMHPSRMAHIAILTYLTKEKWKASISRGEIYRLKDVEGFKKFILPSDEGKDSNFKVAMDDVSRWLCYDGQKNELGLPKVLCAAIARGAPSLFRFLIVLALKVRGMGIVDLDEENKKRLITFVTLVSWFGDEKLLNYSEAYNEIFAVCGNSFESLIKALQKWVARQIEASALKMPPRLEDFEKIRDEAMKRGDPNALKEVWSPIGYSEGLNSIWSWEGENGRNFLLYVCREYLDVAFKGYDPASAIWNEDSRPWDYDHIFPQAWLRRGRGNKQGPYHEVVGEFLMSIGNIAPVPFSINRSKHDDSPGDYLGKEKNALVYCEKLVETVGTEGSFVKNKPSKPIEDDKDEALEFSRRIANRWVELYDKWWSTLLVKDFLLGAVDEDRKSKLECVRKFFEGKGLTCRTVYLGLEDGLQYDVKELWDWARPWLACGVCGYYKEDGERRGRCFACVTINNATCQIGLRKHPAEAGYDGTKDHWVPGKWKDLGDAKAGVEFEEEVLMGLEEFLRSFEPE